MRSSGSGYASATGADEGPRGEQWLPLWSHPSLLDEVRSLFSEGRTRVGRHTSSRALDVARSVARLGVARGIASFERYGFIERNGQANLAVPLGRWVTTAQPHEQLLDDLDPWLGRVRAFARDDRAPKAVTSAVRVLDEAILAVCRAGKSAEGWQALLVALGRAEAALVRSPSATGDAKRGLTPIPPLRPEWIRAADDGSRELRLALALASQDVVLRHNGAATLANVRAHWMPLDRSQAPSRPHTTRRGARFATGAGGLAHDSDVVCRSGNLEVDCVDLVRRRVQLAPTIAARGLGMVGARGAEASLADVLAFLSGDVDDARILALARPLMAIAWWDGERSRVEAPRHDSIDAAYAIARLAYLPHALDRGAPVSIELDPEPVALLASGRLADAIAVCLRRLRASGLVPVVRHVAGDARSARRLVASLAFPISARDATRCADFITKPYETEGFSMPIDVAVLHAQDKLLFDVPLAPVQGQRFQPTGFPDLGAATYETESGTNLLVESAQSMANRLEATCWDEGTQGLPPDLAGLSYVRVNGKDGEFLTSSILEAHRINSVYIEKADKGELHSTIGKEIGLAKDRPIKRAALVKALFQYDVGSLLHGVFLESIDGRLRIARAMSAFIEADGVRVAASGGVKNDLVKPGTEKKAKPGVEGSGDASPGESKTAKDGYGNVPFHRDEFTARTITLFANIDLAQIRGYGLGDAATRTLTLLALFKLRALLDGKLRLRTACDFKVVPETVVATNAKFALPSRAELLGDLRVAIKASEPFFAKNQGVTTVTYAG